MLLDTPFPNDLRVENEAHTLLEAGHEVHLFVVSFKKETPYEVWHGIHVYRWHVNEWVFKGLRISTARFPFYGMSWIRFLNHVDIIEKIEAIHTHDLPLARVGYMISQKWQIPWILDLHENFPAMLDATGLTKKRWGGFFFSKKLWQNHESWAVAKADRVILVVEEAMERFRRLGIYSEKFTIISNTPRTELFQPSRGTGDKDRKMGMLYLGGFNKHRGLETVIRAKPALRAEIPTLHLNLVGDGRIKKDLEKLAQDCGVESSITFSGRIPLKEVPEVISENDICLVPHYQSEHTNTTIPHKLFQYMAMKKPVVVSDCNPLKRIVERGNAGVVFRSGDTESLIREVKILADRSIRKRVGENGYKIVMNQYNWNVDGKRLLDLYSEI